MPIIASQPMEPGGDPVVGSPRLSRTHARRQSIIAALAGNAIAPHLCSARNYALHWPDRSRPFCTAPHRSARTARPQTRKSLGACKRTPQKAHATARTTQIRNPPVAHNRRVGEAGGGGLPKQTNKTRTCANRTRASCVDVDA